MSIKNKNYLAFVRTLPCCNCGNPETEPHHIIGIGLGIMGDKSDDIHSMPLCRKCHEEIHQMKGSANRDAVAVIQIRWVIKTQGQAQDVEVL